MKPITRATRIAAAAFAGARGAVCVELGDRDGKDDLSDVVEGGDGDDVLERTATRTPATTWSCCRT